MRTITLIGIAFTLAACGRDSVGPAAAPTTVAGTYNLTTVDGQVLPFTVLDLGAYQAKLASATLNLKADGTYSFQFGIRIEDSGNIRSTSDSDAGLWNASANAITLTSNEGSVTRTGTVAQGTMTLQSSTLVLGLRKQ
jgi:hypothetical protein